MGISFPKTKKIGKSKAHPVDKKANNLTFYSI